MAIELKKIGDIPTLSLGYTHEVSFDASELSASTGSQTTAVQVGGSAMAGLILNADCRPMQNMEKHRLPVFDFGPSAKCELLLAMLFPVSSRVRMTV